MSIISNLTLLLALCVKYFIKLVNFLYSSIPIVLSFFLSNIQKLIAPSADFTDFNSSNDRTDPQVKKVYRVFEYHRSNNSF